MAKPDLEDGYLKIAYELFAALVGSPAVVGLRGTILWEVFCQTYGWAKRPHAELCPTEIARRRGVKRQNVSRALAELVEMKVLSHKGGDAYGFNKDHESYEFGESPEQRQARVSYAIHAPQLAKSHKHEIDAKEARKTESKVIHGAQDDNVDRINNDAVTASDLIQNRINNDAVSASEVIHSDDMSEAAPLIGTRGIELKRETRHLDATAPTTPTLTSPTPESIRRIADLADDLAPNEDLGSKVAGWCAGYPVAWVEDAVRIAWVGAKPGGRAAYANKCLIRWHHQGGPPQAEVEKIRQAMPALPNGPTPYVEPPDPRRPKFRPRNAVKGD